VREGKFEHLTSVDSFDSLGNYYAYVTALCGFKAKRHEGKITGLAARGRPLHLELLESMIDYEDGGLVNRGRVLFGRALEELGSRLGEGWNREDLSASIQQHSENLVKKYVGYWQRKTGHRNVALAGGLFANVRINEEVHELPGVRSVFVHPGMTDEGIAVGAGLALERRRSAELGSRHQPRRLENVYLGNEYGENEISDALRGAGLQAEHHPGSIESVVADRLAEGKVVARFDGRMEYGPRALGNRSILYQPGDPSVNDWLNELLRRTEFMPFAPSCLHEETHRLFENAAGAEDSARFMTITFHCTPWMAERCRGVVHVDNTARPQIVHREDNASYHRIIDEYRKRTGVPVIINTSFNIHEEPIVRTPDDAIRAFLDSALDYMAAGDFMIKGPVGSSATRKKWEGKSKWGTAVHAPTSR
jgi:carbamoyltransferase